MKITKSRLLYFQLYIFIVLCALQRLQLITFNGFSLKLYHVFALTFLPYLFSGTIKLPNKFINIGYVIFLFITIVALPKYGMNSLLFNYLFGYLVMIIIRSLPTNFDAETRLKCVKSAVLTAMVICLINALMQWQKIAYYLSGHYWGGHPSITTVVGGGVNLEATWIGLFCIFFYKDRLLKYIIWLFSLAVSIIYNSRVGLIADVCVIVIFVIPTIKKYPLRLISVIILCISLMAFLSRLDIFQNLISRFENIGDEAGSLGRLAMWEYVFSAFLNNPFGYGVGNSIVAIETVSGKIFAEGNIHNLYFQFLLDFGFIGFLYIVFAVLYLFHKYKYYRRNEYYYAIMVYFVLALLQFRGGDALFFIIYGLFSASVADGKLRAATPSGIRLRTESAQYCV